MTALTLGSRTAKCLRETLTSWTMAAQSALALWEEAGSSASSSAVPTSLPTALKFQSLLMVACSANASGVSKLGKNTMPDTSSISNPARSATAPMKGGS